MVTADEVLEFAQHAIAVVPCTTNRRNWVSEVELADFGVAQTHLVTTVSTDRIVETTGTNVGPVVLQQIRELLADLLGI